MRRRRRFEKSRCRLLRALLPWPAPSWHDSSSPRTEVSGGVGVQGFAQPCHSTGPIPANRSWLIIFSLGSYPHKQSMQPRGNGHRRLSVPEGRGQDLRGRGIAGCLNLDQGVRLTEAAPGPLFSGPATAKAAATRRSAFRFRQWASIIRTGAREFR